MRALLLATVLAAPAAAASPARIKGEAIEPPAAPPAAPLLYTRSTETISFVWPPEGLVLNATAEFIFGSVLVPTATFTINGQTVPVHKDGGFIAFLPVSPGTFTFRGELQLGATVAIAERRILIPTPAPLPPGKIAIDPASPAPSGELVVRAGDWVTARLRGTPGKKARVKAGDRWRAMREAAPGLYELAFQLAPGETFGPAPLEYELGEGWGRAKARSPAPVTATADTPLVGTVRPNPAGQISVKTGPWNGFTAFPQPGARVLVTGREGSMLRVRLSEQLSAWAEARDLDLAPGAPPRAVTGSVGLVALASATIARISLSERVVAHAEPDDDLGALTVRLYGAVGHTNWMTHDAADEFLERVSWRQESSDVVAFRFVLKPGRRLWGWHAAYDGPGASLRVELRRPPAIDPKRPLAGLRVLLDPGHMPSAPGSIGPMGTKEMDANYAIAEAVERRLRRDGAIVLVTRSSPTHEVGLTDRPRQALERGADLFVSLHNNALPDGSNPWAKPRGFTVFYYHPQSLELGRSVHKAFRVFVPLPDEGLQWGNLLVARLTAMPAILVENAYMIFPEQEAQLNDPKFREKLAEAVALGLRTFAAAAGRTR